MGISRGSPNNTFGLKRGKQVNTVREGFRLKGAIEKAAQKAAMRRVWVREYYHATQTVDVVPIDEPSVIIYGVPIRRGQNGIRVIQPLTGFTQNEPTALTDVGTLLYMDIETEYLLRGINRSPSRHINVKGRAVAPVFWPGDVGILQPFEELSLEEGVLATLGTGDAAFLFDEMGIIFRRDRGDGKSQIVVFADDIVFMRPDQSADDISPVARQGDEGDGLGGGIAGGSSVTRSG